jgi:putative hemolysin
MEEIASKPLINESDIIKLTNIKGQVGKGFISMIMSAFKYNKINEIYEKHQLEKGIDFINSVIEDTEINYELTAIDLSRVPRIGSFIMVSNHPYGGLEALILFKELQIIRNDIKAIGNFLFHKIGPLKQYIFPVNPFETLKDEKSSLNALKDALRHLEEGKPLLIFPAGEVSTYYPESSGISDRKWMKQAIKFIKKAKVPVVPVFFHGSNSLAFHALGFIHPLLRTAKIPSELLNKKNKLIKVRIGNPISVREQQEYPEIERLGRFLRTKTYLLDSNLEANKFFKPLFSFPKFEEDILPSVNRAVLKKEVDELPDTSLLFEQSNYSVYYAPATMIPNILYELGRLREITFREIGEGTNKKTDIDEYDLYYNHLFIWDNITNSIAGAYRIGMGKDIMQQFGIKGFYIKSLFKMKKKFHPVMYEALELGRSFIVSEHQRNPLSLFLLWKGILQFLARNPDYKYLIGPVSISNRFSPLSKSLIVNYIEENHFNGHLSQYIKPKKKFKVQVSNIDTDILTEKIKDMKHFDSVIRDIEPGNYRIPVLLKKYIELNGKIVCFNVDPKFNDALDGLLILNLYNVPADAIKMLSKELNNKELLKRFNINHHNVIDNFPYEAVPQF